MFEAGWFEWIFDSVSNLHHTLRTFVGSVADILSRIRFSTYIFAVSSFDFVTDNLLKGFFGLLCGVSDGGFRGTVEVRRSTIRALGERENVLEGRLDEMSVLTTVLLGNCVVFHLTRAIDSEREGFGTLCLLAAEIKGILGGVAFGVGTAISKVLGSAGFPGVAMEIRRSREAFGESVVGLLGVVVVVVVVVESWGGEYAGGSLVSAI